MSVGYADDPENEGLNSPAAPVATQPPPFVPPPVQGMPVAAVPPPPVAAPEVAPQVVAPPGVGSPEVEKKAAEELGPEPKRPDITSDPTKNVQNNIDYTRQLQDRHDALLKKQGEIANQNAVVESAKQKRELAEEQRAQEARQKEAEAYQAQRAVRQKEIDDAVSGKAAAMKDLTNAGKDETFGMKLGRSIAIALGGLGQALMVKGGVHGAQNEGLKAVNDTMAQDYQRRKDRLAAASASVMEARYGFKDAAENHRAAQNDLDAETAAKYRLIAKEAMEQQARNGVPAAQAAQALVVIDAQQKAAQLEGQIHEREEAVQVHRETAAATNKLAEAHLGLDERQLEATKEQHRETASEARARLALARDEALMRHADRAAALAAKKEEKTKEATVGTVRQNAVLGNLAEAEKAAKDVGQVSIDAINRLQTNTEQAKATEHAATSGVMGNIGARLARGSGLTARGQYDGIPDDEQKKITAANQVITHLTEMQQGKNIETLEQYRDRYSPYVPGLSEAEVRRREAALPGLVAEQRAIQDPKGTGTKRTAGLEGGGVPRETPKKDDHAELRALADKADRGGKSPAPAKSLVINGKTVHYDADGKRVP